MSGRNTLLRRCCIARRELDERTAPMAGLVAAFVFALQMLNFPVAAAPVCTSLGGALAARRS